jgi:hypothetical protein
MLTYIYLGQHIKWKPTSPCKLWKLQSESHDVDPTGHSEEVGGVICKITFANHASHLPWILQIIPPLDHLPFLYYKAAGLDAFLAGPRQINFHRASDHHLPVSIFSSTVLRSHSFNWSFSATLEPSSSTDKVSVVHLVSSPPGFTAFLGKFCLSSSLRSSLSWWSCNSCFFYLAVSFVVFWFPNFPTSPRRHGRKTGSSSRSATLPDPYRFFPL